jgi:signal transduction histidine kinase
VASPRRSALLVATVSAVAAGLVGLVALDYRATRGELVGLLREQAHALRETVAAAARSNRAASALAAAQLGERLLDQARALAALDAERRLTPAALAAFSERQPPFRAAVFGADGTRADRGAAAPGVTEHGGRGPRAGRGGGAGAGGGQGLGRGPGPAAGPGGGGVLHQLLDEGKAEVVTSAHASRWGGDRVAAGVRRAGGGAIVVTVDASEIASLEKPASLESLLAEIASGSPAIAYTVFEHSEGRVALGEAPPPPPAPPEGAEREVSVLGRPVLEFASLVPLGDGARASLRLGLRLDSARDVGQRMALRFAASLVGAATLVALAFGLAGLRQRYGALSEKHALAEAALRRRDRLAAMGELASTVAHEVRNPLNAASMTAQRLRREFLARVPASAPERAELEELLAVMSSETQRIDRIVQQFLEYARPPRLQPEPVELEALVADVAARARPFAETRGVRVVSSGAGAGSALVDPSQLRQALDNLVRNAIEATPSGGSVSLAARREAGGHAIVVSDTGHGIDPAELPRIFDLYFTTKSDGTGVGLAVTQQVVTAHGGTIEVDSKPGAGTTMTVRLPSGKDATRA